MPEYFPDLKSVQGCAEDMGRQPDPDKRYEGLMPEWEEELPEARVQLGQYFRNVWGDVVRALEVEMAVTPEDYDTKMREAAMAGKARM